MEKYTVLLSRDVPVNVTDIAAPLADVLGVPTIEVTRSLRQSPWVLLRDVPAIRLDEVFDTLSSANIPAKAVPEAWLPRLPPPLAVRIADPMPTGLFLQAADSPAPPVLPWKDLEIVSMGLVTIDGEEHYLIDMVTGEEYSLRLRIDGIEFSHDWLGARMASSTRENLKRFLIDVREHAPNARFTGRTLAFLGGELTASFRFPSVEGFADYTQWALEALAGEEE